MITKTRTFVKVSNSWAQNLECKWAWPGQGIYNSGTLLFYNEQWRSFVLYRENINHEESQESYFWLLP